MAVTLAQIRQQVRSYLDETIASDWSDTELNRLINQRYHRVYAAVTTVYEDYHITTAFTNMVADQQEYTLPSDIYKIRRVEINYDVNNSNSQFQRAAPVGTVDAIRTRLSETQIGSNILRNPVYYNLGTTVGFLPIPTLSGTNAIKLWYVPTATELSSDSSTIDIPYPERYWHLIAEGATADADRFGEQNSTEADKFDGKFDRGIQLMQEELEDRVADDSKFIIDVSGDSLDFGGTY